MTVKRDLKRLVRERQARTGESYVTARRSVLAEDHPASKAAAGPTAIPVVEMISVTEKARRLGMKCRVVVASTLAQRVNPVAALERLRDALLGTEDDPGTRVLRAAVLRGEAPDPSRRSAVGWLAESQRFVSRALAGIGGVSESGNMLAFHVDGVAGSVLVIAHVGMRPGPRQSGAPDLPRLVLTTVDSLTTGVDQLILSFIP